MHLQYKVCESEVSQLMRHLKRIGWNINDNILLLAAQAKMHEKTERQ